MQSKYIISCRIYFKITARTKAYSFELFNPAKYSKMAVNEDYRTHLAVNVLMGNHNDWHCDIAPAPENFQQILITK